MDTGVLIHTDDVELFLLLKHILETEGVRAGICVHAGELDHAIRTEDPVAVLLDVSNPHIDALDLCRQVKAASRGDIAVAAFTNWLSADLGRDLHAAGIDAIIYRPFNPELLLAFLKRLRANLSRGSLPRTASELIFRHADIEMNVARVRVVRNGHVVNLSALQFRLLLQLMRAPDVVHSRENLIAECWPHDIDVEPRTVDIHIGHIRRALNRHGPDIIRTVRSKGYSLEASPSASET